MIHLKLTFMCDIFPVGFFSQLDIQVFQHHLLRCFHFPHWISLTIFKIASLFLFYFYFFTSIVYYTILITVILLYIWWPALFFFFKEYFKIASLKLLSHFSVLREGMEPAQKVQRAGNRTLWLWPSIPRGCGAWGHVSVTTWTQFSKRNCVAVVHRRFLGMCLNTTKWKCILVFSG